MKQLSSTSQDKDANNAYSKTFRLLKLSDMIEIAKKYPFIEAMFVVQNHNSGYLTLTLMPEHYSTTIKIINAVSEDSQVTIEEVDALIEPLSDKQ